MDDSNPFKKRMEEERKKKQALAEAKAIEAQAKAKAKAAAKKKATQAVEDAWYGDGASDEETPPKGGGAANSDSDDDMGFQMFTSGQLPGAGSSRPSGTASMGLNKVVNLIDFSEVDVPVEVAPAPASSSSSQFPPMPAAAGSAAYPPQPTPFANEPSQGMGRQSLSLALPGNMGSMMPGFGASRSMGGGAVSAAQHPPPPNDGALLAEIEHLRQMLADAGEEKAIQLLIVQDEVTDKQRALDALQRRQAEEAESLNRATQQLIALETEREAEREAFKASRAEAEQLRAELECMQAAASTAASLELQAQKRREDVSVEDASELGRSRAEAEELRAEVARLRQAGADLREADLSRAPPEAPMPLALLAELRGALAAAQAALEPSAVPPASDGPLDVQLRSLRDAAAAVQRGVERLSAEKRQAPDGLSNREAAQALREVRQNTERQLAWIAKRIRLSAESERRAPQPTRGSVFTVA